MVESGGSHRISLIGYEELVSQQVLRHRGRTKSVAGKKRLTWRCWCRCRGQGRMIRVGRSLGEGCAQKVPLASVNGLFVVISGNAETLRLRELEGRNQLFVEKAKMESGGKKSCRVGRD